MLSLDIKAETRSATICFQVATSCCEMARSSASEEERRHHCLVGLVFVAFAFEAMLNHYGKIIFSDWQERDRNTRDAKSRHRSIFDNVNLQGYLGREPYQSVCEIVEFRDRVAHGRTETEYFSVDVKGSEEGRQIVSEIMSAPVGVGRMATIERLEKSIGDLRQIEDDIENNGYYPGQVNALSSEREKLCERPLSVSGVRMW